MCGLQGHQDKSVHQAHFAFLEMWLLSFSNVIATSAFSTFGYVAQGELFALYAAIIFCYGTHCGATVLWTFLNQWTSWTSLTCMYSCGCYKYLVSCANCFLVGRYWWFTATYSQHNGGEFWAWRAAFVHSWAIKWAMYTISSETVLQSN
jgi:hypothetical protein